eukprot:GHUV01039991.1.p1 GENE.GHUV01039991.1~~GHUV01039991.1.p1  ORF type:complete len:120 (-),score=9.27 GHUV01039991.1:422-781(-)
MGKSLMTTPSVLNSVGIPTEFDNLVVATVLQTVFNYWISTVHLQAAAPQYRVNHVLALAWQAIVVMLCTLQETEPVQHQLPWQMLALGCHPYICGLRLLCRKLLSTGSGNTAHKYSTSG